MPTHHISSSHHRHGHRGHTTNGHAPSTPNPMPSTTTLNNNPTPDSIFAFNASTDPITRRQFLNAVLAGCTQSELMYLSSSISPLLRRDFLASLPPEIGYNVLSFIVEPKTLMRASLVSKHWMRMIRDEILWRRMCLMHGFQNWEEGRRDLVKREQGKRKGKEKEKEGEGEGDSDAVFEQHVYKFSYRRHFRTNYIIKQNWLTGGRMLQTDKIRGGLGDDTVTSLAMDEDWIVVGLSSSRIKVYSASSGVLCRTLVGHDSGVWGVCLVMKGGWRIDPPAVPPTSLPNLNVGLGSKDTFVLNLPAKPGRVSVVQDSSHRQSHSKKKDKGSKKMTGHAGTLSLDAMASSTNPPKDTKHKKHDKSSKFKLSKSAAAAARIRGVEIDPPVPPHHASMNPNSPSTHPTSASSSSHPHSRSRDGMHVMPSESHDDLLSPLLRLALGLDPLEEGSSSEGDGNEDGDGSGSDEAVVGGEDGSAEGGVNGESSGASSCAEAGSEREEGEEGRDGVVDAVGSTKSGMHGVSKARGEQVPEHEPQQTQAQTAEPRIEMQPDDMTPNAPTVDPKVCMASVGWGQPNSIIVSGGCDKVLRVWEARSGYCIYVLHGHTATIRSLRVLDNRPIAVTGSRDSTLRVWDIQKGRCVRVLEGHEGSVRCLDVSGCTVVSGSYDRTCRVWNADTGECLHVLRGHLSQIYSVAFDGVRIVSGGLDTTVRIWDVDTGHCTALLQNHSTLICTLQLSKNFLITGSADGKVITYSLATLRKLHTITAHDSSVTSLQFNEVPYSNIEPSDGSSGSDSGSGFLITGGNDGRARLWDVKTGEWIRDLTARSDCIWKVGFLRDVVVVLCKKGGGSVAEIWSLRGLAKRKGVGGSGSGSGNTTVTPVGVGGDAVGVLLGAGARDGRD